MSAPETNIDKQVRRHRGPLYGIAAAVILVAVLFFAFLGWTVEEDVPPTSDEPAATATD